MYFKTDALVLRETDYKDSDKLLTVLTKDRGKLTLRARGVKQKSSSLKAGCQLLAFSEFSVFENKGFMTVQEVSAHELFLPLRQDIEKLSLASYFAQVAEALSEEDEPSPELLSLVLNAIFALSATGRSQRLIKAAFELRAACIAGYMPMLDGCAVCGDSSPDRFCVAAGMLQCSSCGTGEEVGLRMPLNNGALNAMRYIVYSDLKRFLSFQINDESEKKLADAAEVFLLTQLERGFFTLDFYKSLKLT